MNSHLIVFYTIFVSFFKKNFSSLILKTRRGVQRKISKIRKIKNVIWVKSYIIKDPPHVCKCITFISIQIHMIWYMYILYEKDLRTKFQGRLKLVCDFFWIFFFIWECTTVTMDGNIISMVRIHCFLYLHSTAFDFYKKISEEKQLQGVLPPPP